MHKILTVLLVLALLLAACSTKPAETTVEPTTEATTQATVPPGLSTTPSDFVGFDDPTEEPTVSVDVTEPSATNPQPTVTQPTVTQPTEPEVPPTVPDALSIAPDAEGFIRYSNMTAGEQYAFFKEFGGDPAAFDAWLDTAEAAFRAKYPDVEYDGSGPIILPEG